MLIHLKNITENFNKIEKPDDITIEVYRDSIIKKYETLEYLIWKLLSKVFKASGLEIKNKIVNACIDVIEELFGDLYIGKTLQKINFLCGK